MANNRSQVPTPTTTGDLASENAPTRTQDTTAPAQSIIHMVLEYLLQGYTLAEAATGHQIVTTTPLDLADLSRAIQTVMPAALQIFVEGMRAVVGADFEPSEQELTILRDYISVFYRRRVLFQQIAANAN